MLTDLDQLPIIDWQLATRLAYNKKEVAQELLGLFTKNLSDEIAQIKASYVDQKYIDLLQKIHKLHGAICYCGVPRLKSVVARLETDLKNNIMLDLPYLFSQLDIEVKLLLAQPIATNL